MKEIILTTGHKTFVDDIHFEYLNQHSWTLTQNYAHRNGKPKNMYMHREVLLLIGIIVPEGLEIDHKDRVKLNNQSSNLRVVTKSINMFNRGPQSNSKSQIKGVYWIKRDRKWGATIRHENKTYNLGQYMTIEEAIFARNNAERNLRVNP